MYLLIEIQPLIAVVESGSYNPDSITGNPAFDTYMRMANYYVSTAKSNPETVTENTNTRASANPLMCRLEYDTIYNERIEPKISVRWGQESRMGQFCPNGFSGCANTAIAQIMSYYKYPNSIQLTYTGRDSNSSALDWDNMCNHVSSYWSENRDQYDIQIGRLARQLGELSHSTYHDAIEPGTTPTTGTTPQNARSALTALGYNIGTIINYTHNQNHYIDLDAAYTISNGLRADRLVYMFGYGTDSENHTYGHAWVIDGGIYMKTIQRLMATYDGVNWTEYREMATYRTCLNHINWGWNGNQNGYFVATVLNPHL